MTFAVLGHARGRTGRGARGQRAPEAGSPRPGRPGLGRPRPGRQRRWTMHPRRWRLEHVCGDQCPSRCVGLRVIQGVRWLLGQPPDALDHVDSTVDRPNGARIVGSDRRSSRPGPFAPIKEKLIAWGDVEPAARIDRGLSPGSARVATLAGHASAPARRPVSAGSTQGKSRGRWADVAGLAGHASAPARDARSLRGRRRASRVGAGRTWPATPRPRSHDWGNAAERCVDDRDPAGRPPPPSLRPACRARRCRTRCGSRRDHRWVRRPLARRACRRPGCAPPRPS